jgi:hypothetical protein
MKRPDQHATDKKGQALLIAFFAELGWEVIPMPSGSDYGRDFEIEVFRDQKTTGILFSVQLKSSESPAYSAGGEFLSVPLDVRNARYLAIELETPSILIQADVPQKKLFWSAPQTDPSLLKALATKQDDQSCTVRIPTANELPATQVAMLDTVTGLLTVLATRKLAQTTTHEFVSATTSSAESARIRNDLRDKLEALDLMDAQTLTASGDFDAARRAIHTVIDSPASSRESKFFALLLPEKNERLSLNEEDRFGQRHTDVILESAAKLRALMRKGPPALKFYSLLVQTAADFYALTRRDWGLYQNWKAHASTGDLWWRAELRVKRAESRNRIARKLEQFLRLVRLSAKTPYQSVLPLAFLKITEGAPTLIFGLEQEGYDKAAASIQSTIFQVCKLAAQISAFYSMDNERARAVVSAALLSRDRSAECVTWAQSEAEQIQDKATRDWALETIAGQLAGLGDEGSADEPVSVTTEQQIYRNMAHAVGYNLGDASNPLAEIVRIGIEDLDPTRVLRDCVHMFYTSGRNGHTIVHALLAEQLRLPTVGPKALHCSLYKYTRVGMSLDETYERFRRDYCDKCPDRMPHEANWRYTHEWQLEQNVLNNGFTDGPRSPTYDQKPIGPAPPIPMPGNACAACGLDFGDSPAWWCGFCQTWFCERPDCADKHEEHPFPG